MTCHAQDVDMEENDEQLGGEPELEEHDAISVVSQTQVDEVRSNGWMVISEQEKEEEVEGNILTGRSRSAEELEDILEETEPEDDDEEETSPIGHSRFTDMESSNNEEEGKEGEPELEDEENARMHQGDIDDMKTYDRKDSPTCTSQASDAES